MKGGRARAASPSRDDQTRFADHDRPNVTKLLGTSGLMHFVVVFPP
jgi:hypothetical protein